jgi:adenosylcobinamide amidohydrolase
LQEFILAKGTKLIIKENVLALTCNTPLKTISSAFYRGGHKHVKSVLNVGVPEGYNDLSLHLDPLKLITSSANRVGINNNYLAMVTAAKIQNFSLVTQKVDDLSVSVAATAGCKHGESSGEQMDVQELCGTINIIIFIDAKPSDSCMVAALITATEAKSAALRDLDIRSFYSGDSATGSITDSVTIASINQGKKVALAGPASRLGKAIGYCTRHAVTKALLKQEPFWNSRTVQDRLKERKLTFEKIATELSKIEGIAVEAKDLIEILNKKPAVGPYLLAAAKMDDDYKKNLLPSDFVDWNKASKCFGASICTNLDLSKTPNYETVDLPPFLKYVLIGIIQENRKQNFSEKT